MNSRMRRISVAAATVAAMTMLALSVQIAAASPALSVTVVGPNPGIIDLTIKSVSLDATSGVVVVTGSVGCAAPLDLLFVDFSAVQTTPAVTTGLSTVAPACAGRFSDVIKSDRPFRPGPLVIDASAVACVTGGGCAAEVVRIEAFVMPRLLLRPAPCFDFSRSTRHSASDAFLPFGCGGPKARPTTGL